jgi:hypothetical protein
VDTKQAMIEAMRSAVHAELTANDPVDPKDLVPIDTLIAELRDIGERKWPGKFKPAKSS